MKKLKRNASNILVCIFEIIVGILVLIDAVAFTSGIIIACGVILILMGLSSVFRYFRMEAEDAAINQQLLKGLVLVVIGVFCTLNSHWFINTFPLLTMMYGTVILIAGLGKVQWAVDMIRMKKEKWYLPSLSALVSILCAVIILKNPFKSTTLLWILTGVSLIMEAMFDVVTLVIGGRVKATKSEIEKAEEPKEVQEIAQEPEKPEKAAQEPGVVEEKAEEN